MNRDKSPQKQSVKVWDLPTRLFHWLLAATIFYSWFSVDILEDMDQHFYAGYTALTLILFRLVWGGVGSQYSRFSHFSLRPTQVRDYLKTLFQLTSPRYLGHNPLGSWSALLMLLLILLQSASGLFSSDGYYVYGPLAEVASQYWVSLASDIHALNINFLLFMIALHIFAILFYQFYKKENLTKSMLTGEKSVLEDPRDKRIEMLANSNTFTVVIKSLAVLFVSATMVWLLVNGSKWA